MPQNYDDTRRRQLHRRQEQRRRQEQKRRSRRRIFLVAMIIALTVALAGLIAALIMHLSKPKPDPVVTPTTQPDATQATEPETVIDIAFAGDLNVTDKLISSGTSAGGYDFTDVFMDVAPLLASADASVLNLEGGFGEGPFGTAQARAPRELAQALSSAGVDLIQMANSYTLKNGLLGLNQSLDTIWQSGMEPVGAWRSNEENDKYNGFTLRSIHGIKIAFVAFTKGMDEHITLPPGAENRVNLLYKDHTSLYQEVDTDGIKKVLRAVEREKPDLTVALLHWGSEDFEQISDTQRSIAKLMKNEGVDAIIGTHSHKVQAVEYDEKTGSLIAWSLGDFLGEVPYSIVLNLEITRNNQTGKTKITGVNYTPIYNVSTETTVQLLRIPDAIAAYEAHSIDRVSEEIYKAMKTALSRLSAQMKPKK